MMVLERREIEFRAWIAKYERYADSVTVYSDGSYNAEIRDVDGYGGEEGDSLEQYTELKDANQKKIHEGDFVKSKRMGNIFLLVKYYNGGFALFDKDMGFVGYLSEINNNCFIDGNIHERKD